MEAEAPVDDEVVHNLILEAEAPADKEGGYFLIVASFSDLDQARKVTEKIEELL